MPVAGLKFNVQWQVFKSHTPWDGLVFSKFILNGFWSFQQGLTCSADSNLSIIILLGIFCSINRSISQSYNQLIHPSIHQIDCLFHTEKHIAFLWLYNMLLLAVAILKSISISIQKKVGNDDKTNTRTWCIKITCIIEWGWVSDADYMIVPFEIITLHKLSIFA